MPCWCSKFESRRRSQEFWPGADARISSYADKSWPSGDQQGDESSTPVVSRFQAGAVGIARPDVRASLARDHRDGTVGETAALVFDADRRQDLPLSARQVMIEDVRIGTRIGRVIQRHVPRHPSGAWPRWRNPRSPLRGSAVEIRDLPAVHCAIAGEAPIPRRRSWSGRCLYRFGWLGRCHWQNAPRAAPLRRA